VLEDQNRVFFLPQAKEEEAIPDVCRL